MGNVNNKYRKLDSLDSKIYVRFNGIKFPCISLVEEINTYKQMGREDKIRMIQEFLKTQK